MVMRFFKKRNKYNDLDLDEVFLDAGNKGDFNKDQFEGRIEKPIKEMGLSVVLVVFLCVVAGFLYKINLLQIKNGAWYKERSEKNTLRQDVVFAERGVVVDRQDVPLVWNEFDESFYFPKRKYIDQKGFSTLLGFIKYPQRDAKGIFYSLYSLGQDGVEKFYDSVLRGNNGAKLTEVDVSGKVESQSVIEPPQNGVKLELSVDSLVQERLFHFLEYAVDESGFNGGAGVIMDIHTGEVLAMASYPEFDSEVMTEGKDVGVIKSYGESKRNPFLDRVSQGLYAPGSTIKPFVALGVLQENIINPLTKILSTGSLVLPNPFNPEKPTVFKDWKAHGYTDMREALAVSSDVYFYTVGGGFKNQKGLGIDKIDEYVRSFLFASSTTGFFDSPEGVIPTPKWKKENFNGEEWSVGNTYHSSIGQFGFQVTPLQMARAVGGIATGGTLVEPTIRKGEQGRRTDLIEIKKENFEVVKEGMRLAVTNGTAGALLIPELEVAAKTGTAELGAAKKYVNSWVSGFFPYKNPRYSFAVVLEKGPTTYKVSAMKVAGFTLKELVTLTPEYVK